MNNTYKSDNYHYTEVRCSISNGFISIDEETVKLFKSDLESYEWDYFSEEKIEPCNAEKFIMSI